MIRSILVPICESPVGESAKAFAFWLARKEGSGIHALAVIDVKAFEIPVLGTPDGFMPSVVTPPISESRSLMEEMSSAAKERLGQFAAECVARKIPCSTDVVTSIPADAVSREAAAHDITVLSQTGYTRLTAAAHRLDPLVPQVIRGSVRPVLVAGPAFPASGDIGTVVVAYDGSVHSARALPVAAELCGRPGVECVLLNVAPSEAVGRETLAPAETFLLNHGVTPKTQVVVSSKPSEIVCDVVSRFGAGLLVMGAFGHSPVREMIFGSTTERILSHCSTSVILQS